MLHIDGSSWFYGAVLLGYTDRKKEGEFRGDAGEPMGRYRPVHNLDNYRGEDCVVSSKKVGWKWNDVGCEYAFHFGCVLKGLHFSSSFVFFLNLQLLLK